MVSFKRLCDSCQSHGCCTNSAAPLVFEHDFVALKSIGKSGRDYLQEITIRNKKALAIRKKENSTHCIFWDQNKEQCSIYANRPFDCRAYPFDISLIDGKYYWIVYTCNPNSDWNWSESYLNELEEYMKLNEIINDIDIFAGNTELILPKESQKTPYVIIREVKIKR